MTKVLETNSNVLILWINIALTLINLGTVLYFGNSFVEPSAIGSGDQVKNSMLKRTFASDPSNLSSRITRRSQFIRPLTPENGAGSASELTITTTGATPASTQSESSVEPLPPDRNRTADFGDDVPSIYQPEIPFIHESGLESYEIVSSAFVRYGRKTCPGDSRSLTDSYGFAAAIKVSGLLTSSSLICLPRFPGMSQNPPSLLSSGQSFGSSRRVQPVVFKNQPHSMSSNHNSGILQCVTCLSDYQVVMMFPGIDQCHYGWREMYKGWLVSTHLGFNSFDSAPLHCVDKSFSVYNITAPFSTRDHVILTHVHSGECIPTSDGVCRSYSNNHLIPCIVCARS